MEVRGRGTGGVHLFEDDFRVRIVEDGVCQWMASRVQTGCMSTQCAAHRLKTDRLTSL